MNFTKYSKTKTSSQEAKASGKEYFHLAIEFPDDDVKAYVKSMSQILPNSLLEFRSEAEARNYAKQHFPGFIHFIEKNVR